MRNCVVEEWAGLGLFIWAGSLLAIFGTICIKSAALGCVQLCVWESNVLFMD